MGSERTRCDRSGDQRSPIVLHKTHEPDVLGDFADTDVLAGEGPAAGTVVGRVAPRQTTRFGLQGARFFEKVGLYATQNDVDEDKIYNAFSDWIEY
jgi:hypothetical protein